ncbi:MAG: hypothetical protein FJ096_06935 [Deltaproteobacteria bacterium]|nr:hypothetical protein [Deltaproteobacteria bacterium]
MWTHRLAAFALGCSALAAPACAVDDSASAEDDLTSVTARSRTLQFEGYVYVAPTASDSEILNAVRAQTQTAFGALRTAEIGVNNRELKAVDVATFTRANVTIVNPDEPSEPGTPMIRVRYRYTDDAVVPVDMAKRSALGLAVMSPSYKSQTKRILEECTANDSHAQDFASSIWYVFDPSLASCRKAMAAEQKAIDDASASLSDPTTQVVKEEVGRLYLPTTVSLGPDKTNQGKSYPEYDRLFAGGVKPDTLVFGLVNGYLDHGAHDATDSGYAEWMDTLKEALKVRDFKLASIEPAEDLSTFDVGGKTVKSASFADLVAWETDNELPDGLTYADRLALKKAVGAKLVGHWITLAAPVTVRLGDGAPRPFTIEILTYFGADSSPVPHKKAIKNSDVFIYNGHSYIGYGPLDPGNFSVADFPSSYQILFIDGCVSYNYYEKDYIPLKAGGTKNLDLVTNGLEAPAYNSGYALGRFVSRMIDGSNASYAELLKAAAATDSLRVVDGELDNAFDPDKARLVVE